MRLQTFRRPIYRALLESYASSCVSPPSSSRALWRGKTSFAYGQCIDSSNNCNSFACTSKATSLSSPKWTLGHRLLSSLPASEALQISEENQSAEEARTALQAALTPRQVVAELDKYIVGQVEAKRAMAIALRNRWRRHQLTRDQQAEVQPKNILMIGPTGVGKTEIARRLAKLSQAPFIKVEATKFTEVGFHGKDVDTIVRDLLDISINLTRNRMREKIKGQVESATEERLLASLVADPKSPSREDFRRLLRTGQLDKFDVELDVDVSRAGMRSTSFDTSTASQVQELLGQLQKYGTGGQQRKQAKKMSISDWRPLLEDVETDRLLNQELVLKEAIRSAEEDGIVFIDEIDKIAVEHGTRSGADASSEGVQRDLLPLIEGTVIGTKYGNINTEHMLFICAGAFHHVKPADLLAELQGRLPIRVELKGLSENDLYRILTEPEFGMIKQHIALMRTEGLDLVFTEDGIREIARVAFEVNKSVENIGARRLHTILEKVLSDVSFSAPDPAATAVSIDRHYVATSVNELLGKTDLKKFVL